MITNKIADDCIRAATAARAKYRVCGALYSGGTLGEFVYMISDVVAGPDVIKWSSELIKCDEPRRCREILLSQK